MVRNKRLKKLFGEIIFFIVIILTIILIIQLVLKMSGHSPTESQLAYIGFSSILGILLVSTLQNYKFQGKFISTTKHLKSDLKDIKENVKENRKNISLNREDITELKLNQKTLKSNQEKILKILRSTT